MRDAFALQKLLTFLQQKYWRISDIDVLNFNETLTNDVVSFEQPGPGRYPWGNRFISLVPDVSYKNEIKGYLKYLSQSEKSRADDGNGNILSSIYIFFLSNAICRWL